MVAMSKQRADSCPCDVVAENAAAAWLRGLGEQDGAGTAAHEASGAVPRGDAVHKLMPLGQVKLLLQEIEARKMVCLGKEGHQASALLVSPCMSRGLLLPSQAKLPPAPATSGHAVFHTWFRAEISLLSVACI